MHEDAVRRTIHLLAFNQSGAPIIRNAVLTLWQGAMGIEATRHTSAQLPNRSRHVPNTSKGAKCMTFHHARAHSRQYSRNKNRLLRRLLGYNAWSL